MTPAAGDPDGPWDVWQEVADGVLLRRHRRWSVNSVLVLGGAGVLVVDAGESAAAGAELVAAVRAVSPLPWTLVLTHAHHDHLLGAGAFLPARIWGTPGCHRHAVRHGERDRAQAARELAEDGDSDGADAVARSPVVTPNRLMGDRSHRLDLGGRVVDLVHPGPGHTDHDLVVSVPDAGLLVAGDLVEQGASPSFEDSWPLDWPAALDVLLDLAGPGPALVVPGHGRPVEPDAVRAQRELLAQVARTAQQGGDPDAWPDTGLPEAAGRLALARAVRQLTSPARRPAGRPGGGQGTGPGAGPGSGQACGPGPGGEGSAR